MPSRSHEASGVGAQHAFFAIDFGNAVVEPLHRFAGGAEVSREELVDQLLVVRLGVEGGLHVQVVVELLANAAQVEAAHAVALDSA